MWFLKKRGSQILTQMLIKAGICDIISLPGAQLLSLWNDASNSKQIKITVPRNEWNGVWMAVGYSLAEVGPALVSNTLGPGAANELPALMGSGYYKAKLLILNLRQPPEKRAHLERVFQGLDTCVSHDPWCEASYKINKISLLRQKIKQARQKLNTSKGNQSCRVRLDLDFPILFKKFKLKEYQNKKYPLLRNTNAIQAPITSEVQSKKCLIIGSPKWCKLIQSQPSLATFTTHTLNPNSEINDRAHIHSIAFGYLLTKSNFAVVETTTVNILNDLDTLLLLSDKGYKISICNYGKEISHPLDETTRIKLKSLMKLKFYKKSAKKLINKNIVPTGLILHLT